MAEDENAYIFTGNCKPQLIIIRGIPGAGKSTTAKKLCECVKLFPSFTCEHFEADQYFMADGEYKWDPSKIGAAHNQCFNNTLEAMRKKTDFIIVANTFTTMKEMQPYIDLAKEQDYDLKVIRVVGAKYYYETATKLERFASYKSEHSVPIESLNKMADRFADYENEEIIVNK